MANPNLSFGKIVANPTFSSWSQAYNAGSLFAVVSLSKTEHGLEDAKEEHSSIPAIGKDILNTLEQEYFTLENKDLNGIKQAVKTAQEKIPPILSFSLVVASISQTVLYITITGSGKVILKRGEKIGVLLSSAEQSPDILSASGYIQTDDLIILETDTFAKLVPLSVLTKAITNTTPSEAAETLSPLVHEKEEGAAACMIIAYTAPFEETKEPEETEETNEIVGTNEEAEHAFPLMISSIVKKLQRIKTLRSIPRIQPSKRLFLLLAGVIILVLVGSVLLTIKSRNDAKQAQLFKEVLSSAQKKYDEGQTLLSLNKNIARGDFTTAAGVIQNNLSKFPKNSKEEKDLTSFLAKIQDAVNTSLEASIVEPKETAKENSLLLSTILDHNALFATQDDTTVYFVDASGISSVSKKSKAVKQIVKKDDSWKTPGGIGTFYSNVYLIDTEKNQLIKFASLDSGYAKTTYLGKEVSPDFSKAVSLGVDGSLWVLRSDGSVQKFLRGNAESFSLTGLDKPFTHPIRIFTTPDSSMLYIFDDGSGKIIVFDKDKGAYQKQYTSPLLKKAKDFEVNEKDKKVYILSENKLFEFDLK